MSDTTIVPIIESADSITTIRNCREGICSGSWSRPKVREARIAGCYYGVRVGGASCPDFGTSESPGGNDVTVSGKGTKLVQADIRLSDVPDIQAVLNWWGSNNSSTIAAKMSQNVIWQPYLESDPVIGNAMRRLPEVAEVGKRPPSLRFAPNPTTRATTILVSVPGATEGTDLSIEIFDVVGRLVRRMTIRVVNPAEVMAVPWDGRSDHGQPVESGVFFCRARQGSAVSLTSRLVVTR